MIILLYSGTPVSVLDQNVEFWQNITTKHLYFVVFLDVRRTWAYEEFNSWLFQLPTKPYLKVRLIYVYLYVSRNFQPMDIWLKYNQMSQNIRRKYFTFEDCFFVNSELNISWHRHFNYISYLALGWQQALAIISYQSARKNTSADQMKGKNCMYQTEGIFSK